MSIYATLWKLKFPEDGNEHINCEWVDIIAQGVPAHIGSPTPGCGYEEGDLYGEFLPEPVETDEHGESKYMRAVVFITGETPKGTERSPQEYVNPLLVLSGEQYATITFEALYNQLCDALRGDRAPVVAEVIQPGGQVRVVFEDGSTQEYKMNKCELRMKNEK
jgi:hypothetical protein